MFSQSDPFLPLDLGTDFWIVPQPHWAYIFTPTVLLVSRAIRTWNKPDSVLFDLQGDMQILETTIMAAQWTDISPLTSICTGAIGREGKSVDLGGRRII